MSAPFTVYCLSIARSPITHMAGTEGNRSVLMREEVVTPLGVRRVPCLTGNALRHSCVREPGFTWVANVCGLNHHLTKPEVYFLIGGGAGFEGGGRESTMLITEWAELSPLGGILGGVLPHQIFGGSLIVDRGILACDENKDRLPTFLPPGVALDFTLRSAAAFIGSGWQYTRHHQRDSVARMHSPEADVAERERTGETLPGEDKNKSQQMIFGGECVNPGAAFVHRFILIHPKPLEIGALLWSLRLWQQSGGIVGGMAARGHGQLDLHVWHDEAPEGCEEQYVAHVEANKERFAAWVKKQFRPPPKEEKPKKAKKAKEPVA